MRQGYIQTPPCSRERICAETKYWSAQREAAVPWMAEPQPGRGLSGRAGGKGAALGSSGRLLGRCSFGLSSLQHEPLGPLKPCPDRCCGPAAPPWWRPARIPFHRIWTWAQETAKPEREETAQIRIRWKKLNKIKRNARMLPSVHNLCVWGAVW